MLVIKIKNELKPGQEENKTHRRCQQTRCKYFISSETCRECASCGAAPFEIKKDCQRCLNCCSQEGYLRWDDEENEKLSNNKQVQIAALKAMNQAIARKIEDLEKENPPPQQEGPVILLEEH